ncbi:hypothetical protein [Hymenobacter ruricola]|uniref:DUF1622 domain-containing protein n=1 Tax=Hymenobacter ruricola TaxID=2791023 RepID=A0ABS0I7S5_9BACT|nr:hypothetical protein [Hymenobacter ruricola]MBF9223005.1 hypothetical protein [Hymenobacter ruricola]
MPDFSAYLSPTAAVDVVRALLWIALGLFGWLWLKGELTPKRFLTIVESEGGLSIRLILAAVWSGSIMCMLAAGRFTVDEAVKLNAITELLLLYGTVKVLGSRFARRPPPPPATIQAQKADVDVAGNATFQSSTPPAPTVS